MSYPGSGIEAGYAAKVRGEMARGEALAHAAEWRPGYQYAVVWRFEHNPQPGPFPAHLLDPPTRGGPGNPWQLNVDKGDGGRAAEPPSWAAEGDPVVMQRVYWRRVAQHMHPSNARAKLHEQRD